MERIFQNLQDSFQGFKSDNHARRFGAMQYKVWQCNQLKNLYERQSQIKYNYVIRTRTDGAYNFPLDPDYFIDIDNGKCIIDQYGNGSGGAGDCFAIGDKESMDIYSNLFPNLIKYANQGIPIHCERIFDFHLEQEKLDALEAKNAPVIDYGEEPNNLEDIPF